MRGMWMKNTALLLGMAISGATMFAQQATTEAQQTTTQSNASANSGISKLSPEQKKQMHELRMKARDQAAVIRNDQALSADQKEAKLKDLRSTTREQMKSLLTPEQQTAFANRRAEGKAKFAEKLGLNSDQQSKMKELFQSAHQQRQTVLKNASLSNDQKLAQLSQIRQNTKAQLATILTPDQMTKLQQMRMSRRHHRG